MRMLATDLLEEDGFSVVEASNAAHALELLEKRKDVRLLFTDIQMPGEMDGIGLARRVHELWPEIQLLITSGRERPSAGDIPEKGRFIAKPYGAGLLKRQARELIYDS
jgi:two-component system, response regulator PdtaR